MSRLAAAAGRSAGSLSRPFVVLALMTLCVSLGLLIAFRESALPLLVLVCLGVLATVLARPQVATLLFMAALYLNVADIAATFYGVPPLLAAGFVGLLGIPFAAYLIRGAPVRVAPAMPFMLGLLAASILSSLAAPDLGRALGWIGVYASEGILLVFLTVNAVRTRVVLMRVMWTLVIAGGLMGALSIYQDVTETYDTIYGGFAQVAGRGFTVDEDPFGEDVRQRRVSGPIGEQNRYAQVMLVLLPISVALMRLHRGPVLRLVAGGAGLLILVGTLLTYSRGAAVAIVAMVIAGVAWRFVTWRRVIGLTAALALAAVIFAPAYTARVATLQNLGQIIGGDPDEADGALTGRAALNLAAWRAFVEHPALGVGPDTFAARYSAEYATDTGITHFRSSSQFPAHNLYLGIAADLGVLGLTMFGGIIVVTAVGLWRVRARTDDPAAATIATALLLGLVGHLVSGVFLHLAYARYFFILLGIANAAIIVLRFSGSEGSIASRGREASD